MQISQNSVVSIHYTLSDNTGNILDTSDGRDPLQYIHGLGNLIVGMEEGLEGKLEGDKFDLKIPPAKGYGEKNDQLIQSVPPSAFGDQKVEPGMQFNTGKGQVVTVTKVEDKAITVDANHPLAGVELNFKVEVVNIREASKEEIEHGHVHGPGGHNH